MNRDGLEEMLFDAEAQAFDTLLVFRVDRLSSKVRELAQMVDELGNIRSGFDACRHLSGPPGTRWGLQDAPGSTAVNDWFSKVPMAEVILSQISRSVA